MWNIRLVHTTVAPQVDSIDTNMSKSPLAHGIQEDPRVCLSWGNISLTASHVQDIYRYITSTQPLAKTATFQQVHAWLASRDEIGRPDGLLVVFAKEDEMEVRVGHALDPVTTEDMEHAKWGISAVDIWRADATKGWTKRGV